MDLFDRAEGEANPIKRAARYHYALACRLAWSAASSMAYWEDAALGELHRILDVENMWALCLVVAGWLVLSEIPILGTALNLYLAIEGLDELVKRFARSGQALSRWYQAAHEARTQAELEAAARAFADGLVIGGVGVAEVLGARRVLGQLIKRIPVPKWFRALYEKSKKRREERSKTLPQPGVLGKLDPIAQGGGLLLRTEGAKHASDKLASEFPLVPMLLGVGAVGAVGVAIWATAASSSSRRGR